VELGTSIAEVLGAEQGEAHMAGWIPRVAAATALTLLVAGCSGSTPGTAEPSPVIQSGPGQTTVGPIGSIGSRMTSDNGQQLEVTLNEVRARGQLMTVIWTVKNVSRSGGWQVAGFFSDGVAQKADNGETPPSEGSGNADGVYVVDSANSKRYLPARDPEGNCVCSANGNSTFIAAGDITAFQATFRAPPDAVGSVDVNVPHVGLFSNVAVSR
jgi:hypothetical protein